MNGQVMAVCMSREKGTKKRPVNKARFIENYGLDGDAHAGSTTRQVSLLAWEDVEELETELACPKMGKTKGFRPGEFAENLTTRGIALGSLKPGMRLKVGSDVVLEITQIGKECHRDCEIKRTTGRCIMPQKGLFAKVLTGGEVKAGDEISVWY